MTRLWFDGLFFLPLRSGEAFADDCVELHIASDEESSWKVDYINTLPKQ